jgi:hypothetical protein
MYLVLDLVDQYPRDSLVEHILDCVVQFLPELFYPCTRHGRVRQIISNVKHFSVETGKVCGKPTLCFPWRETDTNGKCNHTHGKRDMSSIQTGVVYTKHCTRRRSLSKDNQDVTSNSMTNDNPCNIDLRGKNLESVHPDCDPVSLSSALWTRTQNLEDYWSSDTGTEFLDNWFSMSKICQYFRTGRIFTF